MTIESDLYTTLNTNAGVRAIVGEATSPQQSRIYPSIAPESAALPRIDYLNVAGSRIHTLPGTGNMIRKRIQINCHARTYTESKTLAAAVIAALEGDGYLELEFDLYDSTTQIHTVIVDWSFLT